MLRSIKKAFGHKPSKPKQQPPSDEEEPQQSFGLILLEAILNAVDINATIYTEHPLGADEIRVIDIQPGSGSDPMRCDLVVILRRHDPQAPYKALSYCWGDNTATHQIILNGQVFDVHKNLFEALYHIREKDTIIRLWTDRICINQTNIPERNTQVAKMGRTYAEADEVLIWLGLPPSNIDIFRDLQFIRQNCSTMTGAEWKRVEPAFLDFITRPWFQRLWVVQEVVLSTRAWFMLGRSRFHYGYLNLISKIDWFRIQILRTSEGLEHVPDGWQAGLNSISGICALNLSACSASTKIYQEMMYYCRRLKCADPRDHVFGTVGVAEFFGLKDRDEVDYSLSAEEVFIRTHRRALRSNPDALSFAQVCPETEMDLPSWVPDLTLEPLCQPLPHTIYSAGGKCHGEEDAKRVFDQSSFTKSGRVLKLYGFVFDTMSESHRSPDDDVWTLEDCELFETKLFSPNKVKSPYGDRLAQTQALWRTLIANRKYSPKTSAPNEQLSQSTEWPSDDDGTIYEVYMLRVDPPDDPAAGSSDLGDIQSWANKVKHFVYGIIASSRFRQFFVTQAGFFGLGPQNMETGDLIVVAPGIRTPLVLRRRVNSDTFCFIGAAYVHGIMKGEFVERLRVEKRLDQPEVFEID